MTKKAKKLSVYLSLFVMPLGAATVGLVSRANRPHQLKVGDVTQETDATQEISGAYRDGLYLGKLDGQAGRKVPPSIGRWNSQEDRASFTAGYEKGYREALATRLAEHGH